MRASQGVMRAFPPTSFLARQLQDYCNTIAMYDDAMLTAVSRGGTVSVFPQPSL